ncbi:hypothetical protein [Borrelia sp. P9F1]|uniref:hypothetical protein n=1 Tax=Borrelia sp. P9F1 TaxID=3058374 RepID=UPI002649D08E|nr:hypothetical protein [Borrelia sp. P9F1]WKC58609.1 hypothetical protein QYZ68_05260 [Borrelia sp. P9F1]
MRRIGMLFYLVLALTLVACDQHWFGFVQIGAKPAIQQVRANREEIVVGQVGDKMEQPRVSTPEEIALATLKKARDEYKRRIDGARDAYDALGSAKNTLSIPDEVKAKGMADEELPQVYVSLDYDNKTIANLEESIKGLLSLSKQKDGIELVKFY